MTRRPFASIAALALFLAACPPRNDVAPPPASPKAPVRTEEIITTFRESTNGLAFRLSNAEAEPPPRAAVAQTENLSEDDAKKLLARVPALPEDPDDVKDFALREKSLPPPRPGNTIVDKFPPAPAGVAIPAATNAPLEVVRKMPEGDVNLAPHLSITFNQPMVPVTSQMELAKIRPPVKLVPEPAGEWQWIGTKTAQFRPKTRFPMATKYAVEVAAGTKSLAGNTLAKSVAFQFATPPLRLVNDWPHGTSVERDPLMVLAFDQAIDVNALLSRVRVTASGSPVEVRLATPEEIENDDSARSFTSNEENKGHVLAIKAKASLPLASNIVVTIPKGSPSAEGPLGSTADQSYSFLTYGPLRFVAAHCGWDEKHCPPFSGWSFEFTNALEASSFDKKLVTIEPELPGAKITVSGSYVNVVGRSKGKTTYKLTFASQLHDRFGQILGTDAKTSITVGNASPTLFSEDDSMIVADPLASGKLSVFSINQKDLRVKLYRVRPQDYAAYNAFRAAFDQELKLKTPPGQLVSERVIKVAGVSDELAETQIDLAPALTEGLGQVLAIVEPTKQAARPEDRQWVRQWIQVTKLGLDVHWDPSEGVAWTSDLATASPTEGVVVVAYPKGIEKTTGKDGLARFPLPIAETDNGQMLIAAKGKDLAFLARQDRWSSNLGLHQTSPSTRSHWFVVDDRKMYKPTEEVHLKGWVRTITPGVRGDVQFADKLQDLPFTVTDARGAQIAKGTFSVDAKSSFDLAFTIPTTANLGSASVHLGTYLAYHSFEIQEFRRPEFEVGIAVEGDRHVVGGHAVATVSGKYYSGGGLPTAPVNWNVSQSVGSYSPPSRSDFHFGKGYADWYSRAPDPKRNKTTADWKATTDGEGNHRLRLDFDSTDPGYPISVNVSASMEDVNRQAWGATSTLLVHPSNVTVGVKLEKSFVRTGENIRLQALVTDLDGKAVPKQKVSIRSAKLDWEQVRGEYRSIETDVQTCAIESTEAPLPCVLATKDSGRYKVTAIVTDAIGRKSQTDLTIWVVGQNMPKNRDVTGDVAEIIPDKKEYLPGDTAEILVVAPFAPAEALVTIAREGFVSLERIHFDSTTKVVKVKIEEGYTPNIYATVSLLGQNTRENEQGEPDAKLPRRPAYASATVLISIPPNERKIVVDVTPKDAFVAPGAKTTIALHTSDIHGRDVKSDLAVIVVDEAVLALSGYVLPDMLKDFYPNRGSSVNELGSRSQVKLAKPDAAKLANALARAMDDSPGGLGLSGIGYGGGGRGAPAKASRAYPSTPAPSAAPMAEMRMEKKKSESSVQAKDARQDANEPANAENKKPITERTNFSALAAFLPKVATDEKGRVEINVKLPDNLTRYRIMALATSSERQFGQGESNVTARLPLMVRPSAPRFLNWGDKFELPIVVQNQTDKPLSVSLAVRAKNATLTQGSGRKTNIAANDRVEVRLPVSAASVGKARFQIVASGGGGSDAATVEIPVWTPATTEAFATYGTIDQGAIAQAVKMPSDAAPSFGGLEITTSSTALHALTDAVLYLVRYPYECNEQLASRIVAIAALRDVLTAFKAEGLPSKQVMLDTVTRDAKRIESRQNWNGGWDFWPSSDTEPYVTVHVTHSLLRAKEKGFPISETMITRALSYLAQIESHIPHWYGPESRRALIAYATYVRHRGGQTDRPKAKGLIREVSGDLQKLTMETIGWILPVLSGDPGSQKEIADIRRHLANRVSETAGAAHFVGSYSDGDHVLLHSDRRDDAVLLEALIGDDPKNDVIPKLVTGLLAQRKKGHWYNTQENAFVLLALDKYFNTYEKTTPNFVARAWLGERYAGEHAFKGYNADRHHVDIPLSALSTTKDENVILQKDGAGRLYFRIGMQYAPKDLKPPPMDRGFSVTRTYEGAENASDVRQDEKGVWHVRAGAKVRVRLAMFNEARRYHVALVDGLPAGFEPMNPALAVTGKIPVDEKQPNINSYWSRSWYEHQNMRDERVEAFTSLLWEGVHDYAYVARATTPGTFVAVPPKAEEMYSPEVFGRGGGDIVVVE